MFVKYYPENKNGYTNRFNYVTPILLKQNNNKVVPSLKLRKVGFATQNLTSTVNVNLSNVNKAYVDDLKTHAKIYRQSKKIRLLLMINRLIAQWLLTQILFIKCLYQVKV
ncbi:hypothetical protein TUA1478L_12490 [Lactiplantibacillus plantarum]